MYVKTGSREEAILALINLWLKDTKMSCVYCGKQDNFQDCQDCGGVEPPLGNNKQILKGFTEELNHIRSTRKNRFASTQDKSMRFGLSMPVGLYNFLIRSFRRMYNEDLFSEEYDINWFMKKFGKYFAVPEEI